MLAGLETPGSSSGDGSYSAKYPADSPSHSSLFSIDTESQEEMIQKAPVGGDSSEWTISDSNTANGERTETFDESAS